MPPITLKVKDSDYVIDVEVDDERETIVDVTLALLCYSERSSLAHEAFHLVFKGRILKQDLNLKDQGVVSGDTVMVWRKKYIAPSLAPWRILTGAVGPTVGDDDDDDDHEDVDLSDEDADAVPERG